MIKLMIKLSVIYFLLISCSINLITSQDEFKDQIVLYERDALTIWEDNGEHKALTREEMDQHIKAIYQYGDPMEALAYEIRLRKANFIENNPNYMAEFQKNKTLDSSLINIPAGYEASGPGTWWDLVYNTPDQMKQPKCHSHVIYPGNIMFLDFNCPLVPLNRSSQTACCEFEYKGLVTQYCCTPFEKFIESTSNRVIIGSMFSGTIILLSIVLLHVVSNAYSNSRRKQIRIKEIDTDC